MNWFRPFCISSVVVLTAVSATAQWPSASALGANEPRGQQRRAAAPAEPSWGTQNPSVLTLSAWDFHPLDDRIIAGPTAAGSYLKYVVSSTAPFPGGYLEAAVHLPSGAAIDQIELAACDDSPDNNITAALYYTEDPSGPSQVIGIASTEQGVEGCAYPNGPVAHTVYNLTNSYAVEVNLPVGDPAVALRAVRIIYRLQVSPPMQQTFDDVPDDHPQFPYIQALAASGVTAGCGNNKFCPDAPLTRGQMAVFLAKSLGLSWLY